MGNKKDEGTRGIGARREPTRHQGTRRATDWLEILFEGGVDPDKSSRKRHRSNIWKLEKVKVEVVALGRRVWPLFACGASVMMPAMPFKVPK